MIIVTRDSMMIVTSYSMIIETNDSMIIVTSDSTVIDTSDSDIKMNDSMVMFDSMIRDMWVHIWGSGMITCSYHLFYDLLSVSCWFVVNEEVEGRWSWPAGGTILILRKPRNICKVVRAPGAISIWHFLNPLPRYRCSNLGPYAALQASSTPVLQQTGSFLPTDVAYRSHIIRDLKHVLSGSPKLVSCVFNLYASWGVHKNGTVLEDAVEPYRTRERPRKWPSFRDLPSRGKINCKTLTFTTKFPRIKRRLPETMWYKIQTLWSRYGGWDILVGLDTPGFGSRQWHFVSKTSS